MTERNLRMRFLFLAALVPAIAPGQAVTRRVVGDSLLIQWTGKGIWGEPRDASEQFQLGRDQSEPPIGLIADLVALPNGGVAVFDSRGPEGPALRVFDRSGRLVRTLGRRGGGPGEYGELVFIGSLAAARDGSILLLDRANSRVNQWAGDGTFLRSVPLTFVPGWAPPLVMPGPKGSFYVRARFPQGRSGPVAGQSNTPKGTPVDGFIHFSASGSIQDTVFSQPSWLRSPATSGWWLDWDDRSAILPDGRLIVAGTDRLGFLVRPIGGGRMLLAEHLSKPEPLLAEERAELVAYLDWNQRMPGSSRARPSFPSTKPQLISFTGDLDGRVWLWRHTRAVRGRPVPFVAFSPGGPQPPMREYFEPPVFVVFRVDGTYLGEVRFPVGAMLMSFAGDLAWGVTTDDDGQQFLTRWRVVPAGGG